MTEMLLEMLAGAFALGAGLMAVWSRSTPALLAAPLLVMMGHPADGQELTAVAIGLVVGVGGAALYFGSLSGKGRAQDATATQRYAGGAAFWSGLTLVLCGSSAFLVRSLSADSASVSVSVASS